MNKQGNAVLGQVLGGVFGQALGRRGVGAGRSGAPGGGLGGLGGVALGSVLAGALRHRGTAQPGAAAGTRPSANRTALLVMLLPLAMRWVQKNGGMGAVLDRFRQQGLGKQAQSWVSSGPNDGIDERAVAQVMGAPQLQQVAQRLGVPQDDVARGFAEILPHMVDQLTPEGELPREADAVLDEGRQTLEKEIEDVAYREQATP